MPDPMDWLLETLDPELHHDVQTLAVQQGVSVQEISELLLRLGMAAADLSPSAMARIRLAAYIQLPEGDPDD